MGRLPRSGLARLRRNGVALLVHRSNRVEALADSLARVLCVPAGGPMQPEWVVVHSRGMERWLSQQLTQRLGVCANVHFPFPLWLKSVIHALPSAATVSGRASILAATLSGSKKEQRRTSAQRSAATWSRSACLSMMTRSPSKRPTPNHSASGWPA
ncbi:MAG: exonuclease V subunit gamma [Deltaproteobacteria bacterium]|nr:exonuclease V subunit gamma [Deltaproteobacteria bacterium]